VRGHEAYHHALSGRSMRCGSSRAERPGLLFGSQVRVARSIPEGPPLDRWPLSSQAMSSGVVPGTRYPNPFVWLLVELVVSSLLCCNRWPVVPGVQDPDSSRRALRQTDARSRSLIVWQNRSSHGTVRVTAGFRNMAGAYGL
jgi:hypothetical protein